MILYLIYNSSFSKIKTTIPPTFLRCASSSTSETKKTISLQKFSNTPMGIWYDQDLKKNFLRNISVGLLG